MQLSTLVAPMAGLQIISKKCNQRRTEVLTACSHHDIRYTVSDIVEVLASDVMVTSDSEVPLIDHEYATRIRWEEGGKSKTIYVHQMHSCKTSTLCPRGPRALPPGFWNSHKLPSPVTTQEMHHTEHWFRMAVLIWHIELCVQHAGHR